MKKCVKCGKEFDTPGIRCEGCRSKTTAPRPEIRPAQRDAAKGSEFFLAAMRRRKR
jgi:hypothetical protein